MRRIVVGDQPRLSLGRTLRITVDGIRYRLFRSFVTVCVIGVAVAFLMNILCEGLVKRSVAAASEARLREMRLAHRWSSKLAGPPEKEALLGELAAATPGGTAFAELQALGGIATSEAASLQHVARHAVSYLAALENMSYTLRRGLLHTARGPAVFDRWAEPGGVEAFWSALRGMPSARFPADREELDAFVAGWPAARGQMERLESGWKKAAARVRAAQGGRLAMECLADGGGAFGEAVRAAGFRFSPAEARAVAARAERLLDEAWMERALDGRAVRQTVARHFNVLPGDVTAARMWTFATRPDRAGEYLRVAGDHQGAPPTRLTPERAADLAQERLAVERMEAAQRLTAGVTGGWMGLGQRMGWLLAVSMLVCGIGIANAMLMTVTERFREIATLKCLGALDGFIMLMFVLESCLLGLIGGVSGGVLGGLLGLGRMALVFGVSLGGAVPLTELGVGLVAAVASGIALAGAASVYPSFRAARLAPMEAMRVE